MNKELISPYIFGFILQSLHFKLFFLAETFYLISVLLLSWPHFALFTHNIQGKCTHQAGTLILVFTVALPLPGMLCSWTSGIDSLLWVILISKTSVANLNKSFLKTSALNNVCLSHDLISITYVSTYHNLMCFLVYLFSCLLSFASTTLLNRI